MVSRQAGGSMANWWKTAAEENCLSNQVPGPARSEKYINVWSKLENTQHNWRSVSTAYHVTNEYQTQLVL